MRGREEVVRFLTRKWEKENGYRLRKELFSFSENKIAVQVSLVFGIGLGWTDGWTDGLLSSADV